MLIKDKEEAVKAYDALCEEMTNYVSAIRENRENVNRVWNPSNKYHTNRGATF